MKPTEYTYFPYARKGYLPSSQGWCNLRVYHHAGRTIIVASEVILPDGSYANEGMSVINAVECCAECAIAAGHHFDIHNDVFIEHLPARGGKLNYQEDFSRVLFRQALYHGGAHFHDADFRHITREGVEKLIGCPFEPIPVPEKAG